MDYKFITELKKRNNNLKKSMENIRGYIKFLQDYEEPSLFEWEMIYAGLKDNRHELAKQIEINENAIEILKGGN